MHKRLWSFILTACLLLALTPDTVMAATMVREPALIRDAAAPAETTAPAKQPKTGKKQPAAVLPDLEGSGTETDPYRIGNGAQLRVFADAVNGVNGAPNTGICAVLTQNINLSGICGSDAGSWTPIGTNAHPYKGTFDGGSFTVSGLYLQNPSASYAGLFAANAGVIKNLGIAGGSVSAGNYAGGLCGINKGTITGCYSTAAVSGDRYTGGVCGYNDSGAILTVCYNTGTVNGSKYVGGICGYNQNTTSNCYNTGTVNGRSTSIGGICGYNKALVSGCYNTGGVCGGNSYVGSLCGYNHSGSTFVNCYYLITGAEKGNYGIAMTQQQFASGEVCWALNEGNGGSVVWKQTCGTGLPGFGGKTVYRTQTYNGGSTVFAYTNDNTKKASAPYTPASTNTSTETANENSGGHTSHAYQDPTWKWKNYDSAKVTFTCQDCGKELILEASVKKETTEPTCTKNGETVYTASVELDGTTFKEKKIVEKEKTGHRLERIMKNDKQSCKEPMCTIECYMCLSCEKFFDNNTDNKKEIPKTEVGYAKPLPHTISADPTWTMAWTSGSYPSPPSATATFACAKCGSVIKETTRVTSGKITQEPTCVNEGARDYTATVSLDGKTYKGTVNLKIPAKGHNPKRKSPNSSEYYCTVCKKTLTVSEVQGTTKVIDSLEDESNATENELEDDGTIEAENPNPNEPLPDGTEPPLPADSEEIPEETDIAPPPVEEPDQPDNPDNADTSDAPGEPDNSGGQDNPDASDSSGGQDNPGASDSSGGQGYPDVSDSSDGQGNPDASNSPEGADIPLVPDDQDTVNELNEAKALENNIGFVSFRSNAAVKSMTQPTEEQQNIPLWGTAIVLMSLIGIVLLIVLRKKHN